MASVPRTHAHTPCSVASIVLVLWPYVYALALRVSYSHSLVRSLAPALSITIATTIIPTAFAIAVINHRRLFNHQHQAYTHIKNNKILTCLLQDTSHSDSFSLSLSLTRGTPAGKGPRSATIQHHQRPARRELSFSFLFSWSG